MTADGNRERLNAPDVTPRARVQASLNVLRAINHRHHATQDTLKRL